MTQLLPRKEAKDSVTNSSGTSWKRSKQHLLRWMRVTDLVVIVAALAIAQGVRFGFPYRGSDAQAWELQYQTVYVYVSLFLPVLWMLALQLCDAYDDRVFGHGVTEFQGVLKGTFIFFAGLAIASYALNLQVARGYVLLALPFGTAGLLLGRYVWRNRLIAKREEEQMTMRVLVVGDAGALHKLISNFKTTNEAGYHVVAACATDGPANIDGVPVIGQEADAAEMAHRIHADVVACASSHTMSSTVVKRIAWALEGSGIELVVVPALVDVAGPRIKTHPVNGMPLLMVDSPEFTGPKLFWKGLTDKVLASTFIAIFSPVLLIVAAAVWLTDRGPIFFLQERVGQGGRTFKMIKFRSMVTNAEELKSKLENKHGAGVLFKMKDDPRVTPIGKWIRRFSVDELPQLFNVIKGDMSIVGPRPPLASEVEKYETDVRRRLLVKPGLTGLWQVNGRSDLSWDEAVRYDLFYVENWSFFSDLAILARTANAVISKRGAY